ncbi:MAG: hypothetical protein SGI71_09535 [Verrucomicrobiota bacterium]|nr:hypothetical protein [Verrucomicrobiota bacterium]
MVRIPPKLKRSNALSLVVAALLLMAIGSQAQEPARSLDNSKNGKFEPVKADEAEILLHSLQLENEKLEKLVKEQTLTIEELLQNLGSASDDVEKLHKQLREFKSQKQVAVQSDLSSNKSDEKLLLAVRNLYASERERQLLLKRLKAIDEKIDRLLKTAEFSDLSARGELEVELRITRKLLNDLSENKKVNSTVEATLQSAEVIDINSRLSLVVINIGRQHGVKDKMPFHILRKDRVIGQVRIVDVRDKLSGATIVRIKKNEKFLIGDRVKIALEK